MKTQKSLVLDKFIKPASEIAIATLNEALEPKYDKIYLSQREVPGAVTRKRSEDSPFGFEFVRSKETVYEIVAEKSGKEYVVGELGVSHQHGYAAWDNRRAGGPELNLFIFENALVESGAIKKPSLLRKEGKESREKAYEMCRKEKDALAKAFGDACSVVVGFVQDYRVYSDLLDPKIKHFY
ncbi:MAG: hypothetical protein LVQ97_05125 [Candidatus Micrarchaeales archaeon]|jgi:hypothetical protein|uniref:Uncharacterized protein n=1 Tax=Candidatus Micrarchaeum acidiphilum ARMAN-2 TaxID=425595 RepID=C7DGR2_MICA2|nr:MAG: hypothetical protein UNLARM2_0261 [Candidatus Micrarchaeum acidiphilum ARMAN-2]MCW6161539.1 hypothetical protein [Candidatus Micrarchaeales archaeon]